MAERTAICIARAIFSGNNSKGLSERDPQPEGNEDVFVCVLRHEAPVLHVIRIRAKKKKCRYTLSIRFAQFSSRERGGGRKEGITHSRVRVFAACRSLSFTESGVKSVASCIDEPSMPGSLQYFRYEGYNNYLKVGR